MRSHIIRLMGKDRMKITMEISDALLREARKVAAREGITLSALMERGLHRVVAEATQGAPFRLRRASFKGNGLQPEVRHATWETIRDLAYEGRGA
jgi:antitoxin component of RelBE/YafQ-DinJ toxin-antitoxin module